jgi:hypothetical protein
MVQTSWDSEWILKRIEGNGEEVGFRIELSLCLARTFLQYRVVQSSPSKPPWQATPEQRGPKSGATCSSAF